MLENNPESEAAVQKKDDAVHLTEHGRLQDSHRARQENYSTGRNIVVKICMGHGERHDHPEMFQEMRH